MRMAVHNFERRGYTDQPISATLVTLLFYESEVFFFFSCVKIYDKFFSLLFYGCLRGVS